ncbi:MAG: hypothetical protein OCD02_13515 [Spirochaetaceae bacterium]
MMKKMIFILVLLVTFNLFSETKSFDDLFKSRNSLFNNMFNNKIEAYEHEVSKRDQEFNKRLKESWDNFKVEVNKDLIGPKPKALPKDKEEDIVFKDETPIKVAPIEPIDKPVIVVPIKKFEYKSSTTSIKLDYFGEDLTYKIPKDLNKISLWKVDNDNISENWQKLSKTEYAPFITQIQNDIAKLNLEIWGIYKLVENISSKIYKNNNDIVMSTAFIMTQLQINCKVAYSGNKTYTLLPFKGTIYGKTYLTIKGTKYYIMSSVKGRLKNIYTYTAEFPGVNKELDLQIKKFPLLKEDIVKKILTFKYKGTTNKVNISYNKTLVRYFENYPQIDYLNYFNSELFYRSKKDLLTSLKPFISGKSESEAVNILLHFVQKSFDYKTDGDQFNREKPFFPEETLHYRYSDCEDRAVLFSYLVKKMLKLEVLGLKYPNHMSTAVLLKEPVGDTVMYKNKKYTITDPTYINSNIGSAMPSYKNLRPEIIGVKP